MQKCCPKRYEEPRSCKCEENYKCEEKKCCKKCDEAGRAKLVCACGNSISNAVGITIPALGGVQPYFLGSITVDNENLCNPKTLLSFSSTISALATITAAGTNSINIFRTCKGSKELVATIPVAGAFGIFTVTTVSFQVCVDNACCDDCASYSFEFVPASSLIDLTLGLSIGNVVITALTIERDC